LQATTTLAAKQIEKPVWLGALQPFWPYLVDLTEIQPQQISAIFDTGPPGETVGVLTLVYDHETHALADKLTDIQHHGFRSITASLHVHLDEHSCLEVIALRGSARRIRTIANELLAVKGVRYGQLVPATRGKRLT